MAGHPLARAFWAQCGGSLSPEGLLTITLPAFSPKRDLGWPPSATHAQITALGLSLDFKEKKGEGACAKTGHLMKSAVTLDTKLECAVPLLEDGINLVGIGIQFFEAAGTQMTPLRDGCAFGLVG